jgi:hypothetical protein
LERLEGVESRNGSGYVALCPSHADKHPSLSISEGEDGRALIRCHAGCSFRDVLGALELQPRDLFEHSERERNGRDPNGRGRIVESYDYRDADGRLLFQAVRKDPKGFSQRRPDGRGGWIWDLKGVEPVLYRLPEVLRAVENGRTVYACEGERDADRLAALGLVATTAPMGAGKWRNAYSEALRGGRAVVLPDNDEAGREHARKVAASLKGKAASVKVLELPGLPDGGGDVSDWLDAGGSPEELERLAREAPEVSLSPSPYKGRGQGHRLRAVRFAEMGEPEERRYVVSGLVPEGYPTVVYGSGGVAKSALMLAAGTAVAAGAGEWLDLKAASAPVLYADFELDGSEQNRRAHLLARGAGLDNPPEDLLYMSALGHSPAEAFDAALGACSEHGVRMMVLDSWGPALEGDALAAKDVLGFFRRVLEPFRAAGVAVVIVDHMPKLGVGEGYQSKGAFGSVYKTNLARSVVQVEAADRGEGTLTVRLRQVKHNFGPLAEPFGAKIGFGAGAWTVEPARLDAAALTEEGTLNALDRVRHALEAGGPAYPSEIADATGLALKTVKNKLSELRKSGAVLPTGRVEGQAEQVSLVSPPYRDRDGDTPDEGGGTGLWGPEF